MTHGSVCGKEAEVGEHKAHKVLQSQRDTNLPRDTHAVQNTIDPNIVGGLRSADRVSPECSSVDGPHGPVTMKTASPCKVGS